MNFHSGLTHQDVRKPLPSGQPGKVTAQSRQTRQPCGQAGGLFRLNYSKASAGATAKPGAYWLCRLEVFVNELDLQLVRVGLRVGFCFRNNEFDRLGICHSDLAFDSGGNATLRDRQIYNSQARCLVNPIFC